MKKILYILAIAIAPLCTTAQVGIGTTTPVNVAALQVDGNGGEGIIIPKVQQLSDVDIAGLSAADRIQAEDIIVYLVPEHKYYFWNSTEWQCINPFATNSATGVVTLNAPYDTVSGNFTGDFDGDFTGNFAGDFVGNAEGNFTGEVSGNLNASGTNTFSGNGTIPVRGIIMWSGTVPPAGWALCDGYWYNRNDNTDNGTARTATRTIQTPDLRGRFIVGYCNRTTQLTYDQNYPEDWDGEVVNYNTAPDYDYTSIGRNDGRAEVTIREGNLPAHSHRLNTVTPNTAGANYGPVRGDINSNVNTEVTGEDRDIENRPPYYTMAFIMRIQ